MSLISKVLQAAGMSVVLAVLMALVIILSFCL